MPTRVDRYRMYWGTVLKQIFTVIKTGKKYEKLFVLAKKDTVRNFRNSISEKLATVRDFREHFEIIYRNNFCCSNI